MFDPATGTWRVLPGESTMGHADGCVAVVGTRVYLFGGEDDSLKNEALDYTKAVDVFDAATETWSTAAPMPFPRQDFCAVTVGTTIFTVGGQGGLDDTALDVMDGLETKTDTWFGGMTLPYPWEHPRAAVVNDKVYLLSGKGEGGDFIFEFDPATREFAQKPSSLLTPRFECAVVAFGGKIYIFTGKSLKGDMLTSTEIYDPSLDK
ncbi:MAG TPA: hypothetical protein GX506_06810 [Firmicutes bacterium]|nr:hypothetical protein [Bacillota bacterium]